MPWFFCTRQQRNDRNLASRGYLAARHRAVSISLVPPHSLSSMILEEQEEILFRSKVHGSLSVESEC